MAIRYELSQGSPEWLKWREDGIGGSEAGSVMGVNPYCDAYELWQRKLGLLPPVEVNEAMERGHKLEPEAREIFELETGLIMNPACYVHDDYSFVRSSLDGISVDERILLEIKCPGLKNHIEALSGKIKPYYYAQMQHQLLTTGAELCYYFSYTDLLEVDGWTSPPIEVRRDEEYIKRLLEREQKFWDCVLTETPPGQFFGCKDAGSLNGELRDDPAFLKALEELLSYQKVLDDAKAQYRIRAERIEDLMSKKKQASVISNGTRIDRVYNEEKDMWRIVLSNEFD